MNKLNLKKLRNEKEMTQADVARHLNIARESYSRYESGEREMTYETMIALAELFNVSTDYLLGREESMPSYLSDEERQVIEQYRALDDRARDAIKNSISFEYSRIPSSANPKKVM